MTVLDKRSRDDPRRKATVLAFLRATEELLDEGASFADLNISLIAERAGRTRTAFYAHFEDRRELLLALFDEVGSEGLTAIGPFKNADSPTSYQQLKISIAGLLRTYREHATLLRAVVEAAGYDDGIAAVWNNTVGRFIEGAQERLRAEGVGRKQAMATATALVWMTERTCYQQAVRGGTNLDEEATIEAISQIWWAATNALRAKDGQ